jgi:hypothetical protein
MPELNCVAQCRGLSALLSFLSVSCSPSLLLRYLVVTTSRLPCFSVTPCFDTVLFLCVFSRPGLLGPIETAVEIPYDCPHSLLMLSDRLLCLFRLVSNTRQDPPSEKEQYSKSLQVTVVKTWIAWGEAMSDAAVHVCQLCSREDVLTKGRVIGTWGWQARKPHLFTEPGSARSEPNESTEAIIYDW